MTLKQISRNYPQAVMAIIGAVVLLGSVAGGVLFMEARYANAEQSVKSMQMLQQGIQRTNVKIDMHAMQQRIDQLDSQMWKIEDRCGTYDPMQMPAADRDRYRRLKQQRDKLEHELAVMEDSIPKPPTNPRITEEGQ